MQPLPETPEIDPAIRPEFTDQRSCRQWLALLPMINVPQAHRELLAALQDLNRASIPALDRLTTLEMLRETIAYLQEANAKKYLGKALPLASAELAAWQANCAMWRALVTAYLHVLHAAIGQDAAVSEHVALVNHRCLRYQGLAIREYALAYRTVPNSFWQDIHSLYLASERGWALRGVKDVLNTHTQASSCTAVYVQALLLDSVKLSGNSARQVLWLDGLLDRWANYITVHREPIGAAASAPAVDLDAGGLLHRTPPNPARARYLDTTQLARSIAKRIKLLRMGEAPAQLGLGEDFPAEICLATLVSCFQQWCKGGEDRTYPRRGAKGQAEVIAGLEAIYQFVRGQPFRQPYVVNELRGASIASMQLFGHSGGSAAANDGQPSVSTLNPERWALDDQSALGFGLTRPANAGMRVAHQQLLAVRTEEEGGISVGVVRWMGLSDDEQLSIGVRILPGRPIAAAMRAVGLSPTGSDQFVAILILPNMPALRAEQSLLVPTGWFKPARIVELMQDEQLRRARVNKLLERGPDFERVTFAWD